MSNHARLPPGRSIRWKLVGIMLAVTALSLLLAGAGMIWHAHVRYENETARDLGILADVVGRNSSAALVFRDKQVATETMDALRFDEQVIAAALYDQKGDLFARYDRGPGVWPLPAKVDLDRQLLHRGDHWELLDPLRLKDRTVGAVYLVADTLAWRNSLHGYLGILGALFAAVLTVVFFVAVWLQRLFTGPIRELAQLTSLVARSRDYGVRAEKRADDEIGQLVDGFNDMLGQIDHRRAEVERAQIELKQRVRELDQEVVERKRVEAELRASEERERAHSAELQTIMEAVPAVVFIAHDRECRHITANRAGYELLRLPPASNASKSAPADEAPAHFTVWHEGRELAPEEMPVQRAARDGVAVDDYEEELVYDDGSRRYLLGNAVPLLDGFGRPRGAVAAFVDITERKQAEQAVRASEEQLRLALDAARMLAFDFDPLTDQVRRAGSLGRAAGLEAQGTGTDYLARIHPADLARFKATLAGLSPEQPAHLEYRLRGVDGEYLWVVDSAEARFDADGRVRRVVGVCADITERKRAEIALKDSEERYRTLVAATTSVVWTADVAGHFLEPQPAWEAYTGQPWKAQQGLGWLQALHEGDRELLGTGWLERGDTVFAAEARLWHAPSGRYRHCLFRTALVRTSDGGAREWIGTVTDIEDRKRAEERFRLAVEAAPSAMMIVDSDGRILLVNRQFETLFGYAREDAVGHSLDMLVPERARGGHGSMRDAFFNSPVARPMGAGRDLYGRRKDGRQVPVEIGLTPIQTEDGTLCLVSISDITERRRAEQELKRHTEELERSNRELGQFAYVASHDLQEPLRAISGCVQLLAQRYRGKLDERADDLIEHAVSGTVRMQTLINDLLSYSRVGTRARPFEPCDLNRVLAQALANLEQAITESGARITWDETLPRLVGDATQLTQLLQNLISNAIKFRGERPPEVHVGVERKGPRLLFYVRDNGIGIEPQYFERIFGVFQRLHTRAQFPGTGIGLAICRKIVERHQGRLWVESAPGQGSTFYFTLPAAQPEQAAERLGQAS